MATVFIAYSHRDKKLARRIAQALRDRGVRVWIDEQDIQPGDEIASSIRAGLESSDAVILVLGKGDSGDSWARREAALALSQKDKRVIPVLASRDADVPYIVRHLNTLDLSDPSELDVGLDRLARHLADARTSPLPMASARSETTQAASDVLRAEIDEYKSYRAKKNITIVAAATATAVVTAVIAAGIFWVSVVSEDSTKYLYALVGALVGIASARMVPTLTDFLAHRAERREEAQREQQ